MKAVRVHEHGGPERLRIEDVPEVAPREDQVQVSLRAVGTNHLDLWVRRGIPGVRYPLPITLGADGAGVVGQVGSRVENFSAGDRVAIAPGLSCGTCEACTSGQDHLCRHYGILGEQRDGTYTEQITLPSRNLIKIPDQLPFEEAAAIPLVFLTAWQMLVARAKVRPGETVVVLGPGSGVGSAAIQIAKLHGARVLAASGRPEKLEKAGALGADAGIDLSVVKLRDEVRRLTGRRGADVIIEHVGAATWDQSLSSLAWGGRLVTCGATTGAEVSLNLRQLFFKNLSLLGSTMGSRASYFEIFRHVEAGRLRPIVDQTLSLDEAAEAHRRLESRQVFGKVVLIP